jgi:hypothetical protein
MESKIINLVDKYITFLFGGEHVYDREQRIYNKLLGLEGRELEEWVNTRLKNFIKGDVFQFQFDENKFEGVYGVIFFASWYFWKKESEDLMSLNEIRGEEYQLIKEKIQNFDKRIFIKFYENETSYNWRIVFMTNYLKMYVNSMSSEELKSHIIQLCEKR